MVRAPLAVVLGEEIRLCMRRKKITQVVIAEKISVTVYVFSRMLRGSVLFTCKQLETIIELLQPEPETADKWRKICAALQDGLSSAVQGENTYWRVLRECRGLSIPALSNLTGITTARLKEIESVGAEAPAEKEEAILRGMYAMSDFARRPGEKFVAGKKDDVQKKEHPLLYLEDLIILERKIPLADLAASRARETVFWEISYPEPVYVVLADCRRLQINSTGFAFLVVAERNKVGTHLLELCFDRKDNFFLRERRDGAWHPSKCLHRDAFFVSPKWSLPVLDMVIKPFDLTLGITQ